MEPLGGLSTRTVQSCHSELRHPSLASTPCEVQNLIDLLKLYTNGIMAISDDNQLAVLMQELRRIIRKSETTAAILLSSLQDCRETYDVVDFRSALEQRTTVHNSAKRCRQVHRTLCQNSAE